MILEVEKCLIKLLFKVIICISCIFLYRLLANGIAVYSSMIVKWISIFLLKTKLSIIPIIKIIKEIGVVGFGGGEGLVGEGDARGGHF